MGLRLSIYFATNANDALFVSKDVARILLAKVYMYQQKWAAASGLLQQVVDKNIYSMEKVPTKYTSENKDLILALKLGNNGSRATLTILPGTGRRSAGKNCSREMRSVPVITGNDISIFYCILEMIWWLPPSAEDRRYVLWD